VRFGGMKLHTGRDCRFCKLANREIPCHIVFEDELVCCFLAKEPFSEGHTLIVPKKHYLDLDQLDEETAQHIMNASILISKALKNEFAPDGISVMQNGGAFNDVGHYHMHIFCRYRGDGFGWKYDDAGKEEFYSQETRDKVATAIAEVMRTVNGS
jgi:histidine triad (HIT) family protein